MILGFYSETQDQERGHTVWTTPRGNQVTITRVQRVGGANWGQDAPDEIDRGEVVAVVPALLLAPACILTSVIEPERPRPSAAFARMEDDDGA